MSIKFLAVHQGGGLGGAPVSLMKLASALDPACFQARVILTEPGPAVAYGQKLGLPVEIVPTGGAFYYSAHARLSVRMLARFVRTFPRAVHLAQAALRRGRPDVLHLNTSVLLAWGAAARREGVPVVWMAREVLGPNAWLRHWHASFLVTHARRVVGISDAVTRCFSRPVDRVYNAVDLTEFDLGLLEEAPLVQAEIGVPRDHSVVMAIGSVQQPKGHWLLLDAFARLPTNADLVLVTGGVDASYARSVKGRLKRAVGRPLDNLDAFLRDARARGLAGRIHVTGFRSDVARMLAAADVLVFPSLEPEGFGRPIIEAMALGRPVVATDVGPSAELVGADAGRLVAPVVEDLACAIAEILASANARQRLGRAGRARVEAVFSLERQVAEMSAIYLQVAR
jgi:glycosyltransferase involved in cell wall biosynthesis